MNKIAVSGYIGFENFGDEAIFCALSKHLKSLGCQVSAICNNPKATAVKYGVETCYYKSASEVLRTVANCDILISGGGSLLQNKTGNLSLFYYIFIIFTAKVLFNKKVIIFSQGFEGVNGKFCNFITKNILKTVDFISLRDENSIKKMAQYGIKADLTSDPIYSLLENIEIEKEKKGLLIQLRDARNLSEEFIKNLAFAISKTKINNLKIIPFQKEYDCKICTEFSDELKKYDIKSNLIQSASANEVFKIINSAKYMISTRLHGAIVSNALKTKTFALAYDDKIKTFCNELNIENIDIYNYTKDELVCKIAKFIEEENDNYTDYRKFNWSVLDNYLTKAGLKID